MQALRQQLTALTAELHALGITGLAYPADRIECMTKASLVSCITWAENLIAHVKQA